MPVPVYSLKVDWTGNGTYGEAGEVVTARLRATGVSCERGRDQIRQLAPPATGRLDADLVNTSRDYSTENAGSPLVGKLLPGRRVDFSAVHSAVTYRLFNGILGDIPQHPTARTVSIPSLGTLSRLVGKTVTTGLYTAISTDAAIGHILDAVGWPAGERALSVGKTTLAYWWLDGEDALAAIVRLMNTEGPGASVYERGDGYFVFEDRHYRLTQARCTASQATFAGTVGAALTHGDPFDFNAQLREVINTVSIPINLRTPAALAQVWALGTSLILPASVVIQIVIAATGGEPFQNAVSPELTTDYTLIAGAATLTLDRTSGRTVTLTVTAGAGGATITGLRMRAELLAKVEVRVVNTVDCSASIAVFGVRTLNESNYPVWPEIDLLTAQDFANAIATTYRDPRATATITVQGDNDAHRAQCLGREIGDRIHVQETQSGLNSDMFIERVAHTAYLAGRHHVTRLGCEKAPTAAAYAMWGTAVWDTSLWAY